MAASNVDASTTSVGVFDAGDPEELASSAAVHASAHRFVAQLLCRRDFGLRDARDLAGLAITIGVEGLRSGCSRSPTCVLFGFVGALHLGDSNGEGFGKGVARSVSLTPLLLRSRLSLSSAPVWLLEAARSQRRRGAHGVHQVQPPQGFCGPETPWSR